MNRRKVMVLVRLPEPARALLEARDDVDIVVVPPEEQGEEAMLRLAPEMDAGILAVAPFTRRIIEAAPRLSVVSRFGVGYDAVDIPALTERGIPLTVVGEANSVSVAEQALTMMLALAKRVALYDREVRTGNWLVRFDPMAMDVWRKSVLILGYGRIGRRLAKRCLAFEMDVHVHDPYVEAATIERDGCRAVPDFRAVLGEMDFVSVNCPKNAETTGMIAEAELAAMRPSAFVVNTARGGIVDEAALCTALDRGEIAGAGIDAFVREPATADDPICRNPRVLVSPHSAGVTAESVVRMGVAAAQNVLDAFDGQLDPNNVINKEVL